LLHKAYLPTSDTRPSTSLTTVSRQLMLPGGVDRQQHAAAPTNPHHCVAICLKSLHTHGPRDRGGPEPSPGTQQQHPSYTTSHTPETLTYNRQARACREDPPFFHPRTHARTHAHTHTPGFHPRTHRRHEPLVDSPEIADITIPPGALQVEDADHTAHIVAIPDFESRGAVARHIDEEAIARWPPRQPCTEDAAIGEHELAEEVEVVHFRAIRRVDSWRGSWVGQGLVCFRHRGGAG
jgi:hypothetical protein